MDVEYAELGELNDSAPAVDPGEVGGNGAVPVGLPLPIEAELLVVQIIEEFGKKGEADAIEGRPPVL